MEEISSASAFSQAARSGWSAGATTAVGTPRTPRISHLARHYDKPGRDHWGAVQTVWFAGGGVRGGTVIGSSDRQGGRPASNPQRPENMAATIYQALGIPATAAWKDDVNRPHHIYNAQPIEGLTG